MSTVSVKGLAELQKLLDTLPVKMEKNVMRSALRAGANVILPVARSNIRPRSGTLARSLKVGSRARGGVVTASVSTKVFYARFVEFGTKPHRITAKNRKGLSIGGLFFQSVSHPGAQPRPFLRPAMDTQAQAALVAVGEKVRERLTKQGLDAGGIAVEADI